MTFLNPFVLFGLAAAAFPLILHLLNLRKLRTVEFSSLRFLKELQKSSIQRVRIRQILLLLVRTLLIAAIVFAFSRPATRGSFAGIGGTEAASTLVVLLDDSPSMAARDRGSTVFERARRAAAALLDASREGDHVYLLPLSSARPDAPLPEALTPAGARAAIAGAAPASSTLPMYSALRQVNRLLVASADANKEVAVITDGQRMQFAPATGTEDSLSSFDTRSRVFLQPLTPSSTDNAAVTESAIITRIVSVNKPVRLRTRVTNFGDAQVRGTLMSVFLDHHRVAQRTLDVPPHASSAQEFSFTPRRPGIQAGSVTIEDDNLAIDNARHFSVNVPEVIKVLLLGPTTAATALPALALTLGGDSSFSRHLSARQLAETELPSVDLEKFDVIILCGARGLASSQAARVARFVTTGGGLVIFPGPESIVPLYNEFLLADLRIPGFGSGPVTRPKETPLSFSSVEYAHPLFEGLFEQKGGLRKIVPSVESPLIRTAMPLPVGPAGNAVIELSAGGAFLAEYPSGRGRVFLFAVEPGLTWSDFPAHAIFAPLLHRMVVYLAGGSGAAENIAAGSPLRPSVRLRDFSETDVYSLSSASGVARRVVPQFQGATGVALFDGGTADSTGAVFLTRTHQGEQTGEEVIHVVTVNPPPGESDLTPARPADFARFWAASGIDSSSVQLIGPDDNGAETVRRARFGVELWKYCVSLALVLAIAEMALGRAPRSRAEGNGGEPS